METDSGGKNLAGAGDAATAAPAASLERDSVFAGYRVGEVLGRGGMGVVYRALELGLGRPVALKVIAPALASDSSFRSRFEREARAAAALDHPNIVPVYAAGEQDGVLYMAMRFVDGPNLRALIGASGRLEPARAAELTAQVASALGVAHAHGLVHRDVKPANVFVTSRGHVEHAYLGDFGLTKSSGADGGITRAGESSGRSTTSRPSRSAASGWTAAPTCMRSAVSSTRR
jgi:serine/threonine protein kinase